MPNYKGYPTAPLARMIGFSLFATVLGAALTNAYFSQYGDAAIPTLVVACVAGIVGAVIGAAVEIVTALRQK